MKFIKILFLIIGDAEKIKTSERRNAIFKRNKINTMNKTDESFRLPNIYNFKPFYTKQPNRLTLLHQISLWSDFIVSYARHFKLFELNVNDDLFSNDLINS